MSIANVNLAKLEKMLEEWKGELRERGKVVGRLKHDLEVLKASERKADIDPVLAFYETILIAGKAAGKVELLEGLIRDLQGKSKPPDPYDGYGEEFTL